MDTIVYKEGESKGQLVNVGDIVTIMVNGFPTKVKISSHNDFVWLLYANIAELKKGKEISYYIEQYFNKIMEKHSCSITEAIKIVHTISSIDPGYQFKTFLRLIAIDLDKNYPDHISESPEIYSIDSLTGKIVKIVNRKGIKSYKNFAAFRNINDAKIAFNLLREFLKSLYAK